MRSLALALVLAGCATLPSPAPVRTLLDDSLQVAAQVQAITVVVCEVEPTGRPCLSLIEGLDYFYDSAELTERLLNAGLDAYPEMSRLYSNVYGLLSKAWTARKAQTNAR